jgi:hypothetical protein
MFKSEMNLMRFDSTLLGVFLCLLATPAHSQSPTNSSYTEVFYPSGTLRIHAFLYKPDGDGPFPVVIYNHSARSGRPRRPEPNEYIGRLLTRAGYAVLVPERHGYGDSDGPHGGGNPQRLWAAVCCTSGGETDDVFAALDYLPHCRLPIPKGSASWVSLGGIVLCSPSAAVPRCCRHKSGRRRKPGTSVPRYQRACRPTEKATTPALLQVAQNDRTTDSITTLAKSSEARCAAPNGGLRAVYAAAAGLGRAGQYGMTRCSGPRACMCGKRT